MSQELVGTIIAAVGIVFVVVFAVWRMNEATRKEAREAHEKIGERINEVDGSLVGLHVEFGGFRGTVEEQIRQLQATADTTSGEVATLNTRTAELTGAIEVITKMAIKDRT